jgi:hypothetical protein
VSFYIYGLRLGGDPECRYIGQTAHDPETRLSSLTKQADRAMKSAARGYGPKRNPDGFHAWLSNNRGNVEAFKIAKVATRAEAHAMERVIVALVLRLEHRLFNTHLVPADRRIAWRAEDSPGSSLFTAKGVRVVPPTRGRPPFPLFAPSHPT